MAIKLRRQASANVTPPPSSHVAFFIDENGNPATMNNEGVVAPAVSVTGAPLSLTEQLTAPEPEASTVKLYSKDVSGAAEFFVIDDRGNEVQITSDGAVNAGGSSSTPTFNWKGGTPGNPYVNGDEVTAAFGTIVVISTIDGEAVLINLPAIATGNAAQTIGIRNVCDKKLNSPGAVILVPDSADQFEAFPVGMGVALNETFFIHHTLESDGVGRWIHSGIGGGSTLWVPFDP